VPVRITAPDVTPSALTAPGSAATQQTISVSWTVVNRGDATASATWRDGVYLSDAPVCCGAAPNLTANRPAPLAPGASYTLTRSLAIPKMAPGNYYLVVYADDGRTLRESDDANNQRAIPIAITTPDLVAANLTAPASVRPQQVVSLSWTVANQGAGSATPAWTDSVYLSTDPVCCTGDVVLASQSHTTALAAGASYTVTRSATIPNRPPGNYFLILKTDTAGVVYEADDANNLRVVPLTISP